MTKLVVYKKLKKAVKYKLFIKFNTTCHEILNNCLHALYNSNSFEDAIRKTLLMVGEYRYKFLYCRRSCRYVLHDGRLLDHK